MIKIASFVFNAFTHDSRVLKEAVSLKNAGYDIVVIAHGYKDLPSSERIQDVKVRRFSYFDRKVTFNKFIKIKIYLSYLYQAIKYTRKFDIAHCHDLNTLLIGVIIKKLFNKQIKIVYDAHEYETQTGGLSLMQQKRLQKLEGYLISYIDKSITVSNGIANEYVRLYNIDKPALVLNTPTYTEVENKDLFRQKYKISKEQTIFLYQGGFNANRGIEVLLETFTQVEANCVIVFMGYGPLEPLVKENSDRYENIYFHEAVSPDVLLDYTSSADFGILFYENSCLNHYYCSPNKMFEYLMAEIPVIVSNLYEMKKIVEKNKIGVVALENDVEGLKEAIIKIDELDQEELKANIKKINRIYNWEEQEKVLLKLYEDITT